MKPDVIVCWPRNCDYPLWRKFIRDERYRFARVFVMFTENMQDGPVDYSPWVREQLGNIAECFDSPPTQGRDWRDVAVNAALDRSTAEWVWFTEQDFLIHEPERFWRVVYIRTFDMAVGWQEHDKRWHPSCMFVRRTAIEKTTRNFGPVPIDHFWMFGAEIESLFGWEHLENDIDFEHLQGLSQNHYLVDQGIDAGVFNRPRFREYLTDCLESGVPLDQRWADRAQREIGMVSA